MTEDRLNCFHKHTYYGGGGFLGDPTYEFNHYDCQIRCQKNKGLSKNDVTKGNTK